MLHPSELVQHALASEFGSFWRPGVYHSPLPEDILPWYATVVDSGHCILCILPMFWKPEMSQHEVADYLVSVPVKSVLRGYEIREGIVVPTSPLIRYDANLGLITPEEDTEY